MPLLRFLAVVMGLALMLASAEIAAAANLYAPSYSKQEPEAVNGYGRAGDGALTPLPGSPFAVGPPGAMPNPSGLGGIAFTPDGTRAVAPFSFRGGVIGVTVAANGAITPVPGPTLTPSATSVAVSPDGRFAYVTTREFPPTNEGVGVIGFSIGPDGSLNTLPGSPFGDADNSYYDLAITPDGRHLFAESTGALYRFAIAADGSLDELAPAANFSFRSLEVSPDGRFLFGTETGGATDNVVSLAIGADGSLSEAGQVELADTDNYFSVAPDGRHLYLPSEGGQEIDVVGVGPDGQLSVTDSTSVGEPPSVTAVSPDGRYLYYGKDGGGAIRSAAIAGDGGLSLLPGEAPWESGEPNRFEFQPGPTPVASFVPKRGAPGTLSKFNAAGSARATRFDWDFGDGTVVEEGRPVITHVYKEPGIYPVTLKVYDTQGCSTRQVYTGQSTSCPGGASAAMTGIIDTLPAITGLKAKPRKFVPGKRKRRGTRFLFTLTERARVSFTIYRRKKRGARVRKRSAKVGVVRVTGRKGKNRARFTGILKGKPLKPGSYRVEAVATDGLGGDSETRRVRFKVKPVVR